jgi:imidazolonepropionase-like amidohydrolase
MKGHKFLTALVVVSILAPLVTGCSIPSPTSTTKPTLVLINGVLIDGTGADAIHDAAIVIRDGNIIDLGTSNEVSIPPDAQVIDVKEGTILPGFINAHVHKAFDTPTLVAWAQAGVTTVRDVGTVNQSIHNWDEWMTDSIKGRDVPPPIPFSLVNTYLYEPRFARVLTSGPIVTVPEGYPIPVWGPDIALTVTSPEDAQQKIQILLDAGADFIKIALKGENSLTREEVEAIVDVAHERGVIVTAHVSSTSDLVIGVDAGIDDAAHMVPDYLPDELIERMVADDLYVVATLAVLEAYGESGSSVDNLRRFVAAGGKVALGDDYGNPGIELGMPIRDIELMEEGGMTPMEIIVAGTKHGAHICNLEEQLGTLKVGKIADVLVVEGNPLLDIHVLTRVMWVIKDGIVIRSPND